MNVNNDLQLTKQKSFVLLKLRCIVENNSKHTKGFKISITTFLNQQNLTKNNRQQI